MFDLGADEILFTTVVAIVAIGPKELPRAMRLAGRWIGKFRRYANAIRAGIDTMIREAETKELEQEWSAGRDEVLAHLAEQESANADAGRPARAGAASHQAVEVSEPSMQTVISGDDPLSVRDETANRLGGKLDDVAAARGDALPRP